MSYQGKDKAETARLLFELDALGDLEIMTFKPLATGRVRYSVEAGDFWASGETLEEAVWYCAYKAGLHQEAPGTVPFVTEAKR